MPGIAGTTAAEGPPIHDGGWRDMPIGAMHGLTHLIDGPYRIRTPEARAEASEKPASPHGFKPGGLRRVPTPTGQGEANGCPNAE